MIWSIFFISLGLASALSLNGAESEFLDVAELEEELSRFEDDLARDDESEGRNGYFNQVSELGDIVLTEEQARQGLNFNKYGSYKWPNGRVYYTVDESQFSRDELRTIYDSINDMNNRLSEYNKVQLVWRNGQSDYINVIKGNGCWSYLGRTGGEQALSLGNGCCYKNTIQHEFMHAIGFTHEQNRADRDDYVDVLWPNIPENWRSQYQKVNEDDFPNIGNYELQSIMHYPWWAPDSGWKDAFGYKGKNVDKNTLGQGDNGGLTQMDVYKINYLYWY